MKSVNPAIIGFCGLLLLGSAGGAFFAWSGLFGPSSGSPFAPPVSTQRRDQSAQTASQPFPASAFAYAKAAAGPASAAFAQSWEISRLLPATSNIPPKPPGWRVVGTTEVAGVQSVLVLFEGVSAPEAKVVGDKLPGGAQILGVDGTSVSIRLNGKRVYLNTVH